MLKLGENGQEHVWKVAYRAVAGHILVMVLVPPGEEGVQPLSMVTIKGARQKPSKGTTSHFCIHKALSASALCCDTIYWRCLQRSERMQIHRT